MKRNIIDEIEIATDAESDSDLARKLSAISNKKIHRNVVCRWRASGFFGSTEAVILLLLKKIKELSK